MRKLQDRFHLPCKFEYWGVRVVEAKRPETGKAWCTKFRSAFGISMGNLYGDWELGLDGGVLYGDFVWGESGRRSWWQIAQPAQHQQHAEGTFVQPGPARGTHSTHRVDRPEFYGC